MIVNDDGVHAGGIVALAGALAESNDVTVIAPDRERSATSHSITLDRPITIREHFRAELPDVKFYSINGTPVDCVHVAGAIPGLKPELVVSGINNGANLGGDVSYSGTVHAALEAAIYGYPAIALSLRVAPHDQRTDQVPRYMRAAQMSAKIIASISLRRLDGIVYNINFPADLENCQDEIRVCPQGKSVYSSVFQKQTDPFGREVYWLYAVENGTDYNEVHKTDVYWSNKGYVTCTPMTWNSTAFGHLESVTEQLAPVRLRPDAAQ